jgi:hypothetical protein
LLVEACCNVEFVRSLLFSNTGAGRFEEIDRTCIVGVIWCEYMSELLGCT